MDKILYINTVPDIRIREMVNTIENGNIDYSKQYLTFKALEDCVFTLTISEYAPAPSNPRYDTHTLTSISYSIDGGETWVTTNNVSNQVVVITTPTIHKGQKVLWKGIGTNLNGASGNTNFSSTGKYEAYGNILSLIEDEQFDSIYDLYASDVNRQTYRNLFTGLFKDNQNLMSVENLILPLNINSDLSYCYAFMFQNCTSITKAPVLPSTYAGEDCYRGMFQGCSSLQYIKALFLNTPTDGGNSGTRYWVQGVSETGTFVQNEEATWETKSNNYAIPYGWDLYRGNNKVIHEEQEGPIK